MWYIYVLCDPRESDPIKRVRYVGKTRDLKYRLRKHCDEARKRQKTHRAKWINSLIKIGIYPVIEEIIRGDGDWEIAEIEQIKRFRQLGCNLTNATDGGEGSRRMPPCSRDELASLLKQGWSYQRIGNHYGKKTSAVNWVKFYELEHLHAPIKQPWSWSDETRVKQASRKRQKHTEESKVKMSVAVTLRYINNPISEETRAKLHKAHLGKTPSHETRRKMSQSQKTSWAERRLGYVAPANIARTKLTDDQVREIRQRYRRGLGPTLAKEYNVHRTTITNVVSKGRPKVK